MNYSERNFYLDIVNFLKERPQGAIHADMEAGIKMAKSTLFKYLHSDLMLIMNTVPLGKKSILYTLKPEVKHPQLFAKYLYKPLTFMGDNPRCYSAVLKIFGDISTAKRAEINRIDQTRLHEFNALLLQVLEKE